MGSQIFGALSAKDAVKDPKCNEAASNARGARRRVEGDRQVNGRS